MTHTNNQSWMLSNAGQALTIYNLAFLSSIAYYRAFTPSNITSGFKKTGIVSFNEHIFPEDVFLSSMVTDQAISRQQVENNTNLPAPIIDSTVTANDVPGTSGTTGTIITPENVRPYPKAVPRARKSNRKRVKSAIITDLTTNSIGTAKKKTAVKQLKTVESYSNSETEPSLVESGLEVDLTDMSEDELEISASDAAMKQGNYVLVAYEGKRKVHFVGQILKEEDEDGDLEIKFLQKHPKISNGFV